MRLALEDLLLDRPRRDEPIHEAVLLLAVTPHSRQGLLVRRRVPVGVEEDQPVGTDQVQAAAAGLAAEQEDELLSLGVVELVHQLLAFVDVHRAVQTQRPVASGAAQLVEDVEGLGVVADQHDLVVGVLSDASQHAVEHHHLARVPRLDVSIPAASIFGHVIGREEFFAAWEVARQVQKVRVVAQLLEQADGLERLTALASEQAPDVRALDEVLVQRHL